MIFILRHFKLFLFLFFLSGSSFSSSSYLKKPSLDSILRVKDSEDLQSLIYRFENTEFLRKLCDKQKQEKKIPVACYQLGQKSDFWCLHLKLEDPRQLKEINQALKSPYLSKQCWKSLKIKTDILKYRKKDLFLPELKKYFTE